MDLEGEAIDLDLPNTRLTQNYGSSPSDEIPVRSPRRKSLSYIFLGAVLLASCIGIGVLVLPTNEDTEKEDSSTTTKSVAHTMGTQCPSGEYELKSSDKTRKFTLYTPSGATEKSSIIFVWHGISASPSKIKEKVNIEGYADENDWVIAYPSGSGFLNAFNGLGCCDSGPNDVQFAQDIITYLSELDCGSSDNVYSTGFSNGGFMSHLLGCEVGGSVYKAVAVHSGLIGEYSGNLPSWNDFTKCSPSKPTPVLAFHGTADGVVKFEGGNDPNPFSRAKWFSFDDSMNVARKSNGCDDANDYTVTLKSTTTCVYNTECDVRKCVVDGLAHDWAGNVAGRDDPDATELMVAFFKLHGA